MASKKRSQQEGEGNDAIVVKKPRVIDNKKSLTCVATHFAVGAWERIAAKIHDQSIVIKLYFKKSLMAWEFVGDDRVSKNKMEIQFANIAALKIDLSEATFQIMLKAAPRFLRDLNKDPNKNSKWVACGDFTDDQASNTRLFTFTFYTDKLEAFHRKILAANSDMNSLFNWPLNPMKNDPNSSQQGLVGYPTSNELGNHVAVAGPSNCVGPSQFPPIEHEAHEPHHIPDLIDVKAQSHHMASTGLPVGHVANFVDPQQPMGMQDQGQVANGSIYPRQLTDVQGQSHHMTSAVLPVGHVANFVDPQQPMGEQDHGQIKNGFEHPRQLTGVQGQSHHMAPAGYNVLLDYSSMEAYSEEINTAGHDQYLMFSQSLFPPLEWNSEEIENLIRDCFQRN